MNTIKLIFGFLFGKGKSSGIFSAIFLVATLASFGWNWWEGVQADRDIEKLEQLVDTKQSTIDDQRKAIDDYKDSLKDARIEQQEKLSEARKEAQRVEKNANARIQEILQNRSTDNVEEGSIEECVKAEDLIDRTLQL